MSPTQPTSPPQAALDTDLDGASGITTFVSGGHTYAAVAAFEDDGVQILNVTDPLRITAVSSITDTRGITGLVLDGASDITTLTSGDHTYVAVASNRDSGVQILDVTDPSDITAAGNIADDGNITDDLELYRAQGITTFTSGDHIYAAVAAFDDNGVQIIRIDIPPDTTLPADAFVTTWRTTSEDESITLPLVGTDITINWGDGSTTAGVSTPVDHTYNTAGDYTVQITGGLTWFHLNGAANAGPGWSQWTSGVPPHGPRWMNAFERRLQHGVQRNRCARSLGVTDMSNMFEAPPPSTATSHPGTSRLSPTWNSMFSWRLRPSTSPSTTGTSPLSPTCPTCSGRLLLQPAPQRLGRLLCHRHVWHVLRASSFNQLLNDLERLLCHRHAQHVQRRLAPSTSPSTTGTSRLSPPCPTCSGSPPPSTSPSTAGTSPLSPT